MKVMKKKVMKKAGLKIQTPPCTGKGLKTGITDIFDQWQHLHTLKCSASWTANDLMVP